MGILRPRYWFFNGKLKPVDHLKVDLRLYNGDIKIEQDVSSWDWTTPTTIDEFKDQTIIQWRLAESEYN